MAKLTKPKFFRQELAPNTPGSTAISPQAVLAWGRIPSHNKAEIIAAVEHASPAGDADTKSVKVGTQVLKVRSLASGFRVIYEAGNGHNTIVSVLTPREARLIRA